ncbi:hypothetical protein [Nocardia nova]|uniref:hypothetical protein n=1 Tax=Nocardia nova TaxID=37330 RepID=UPI00340179EB
MTDTRAPLPQRYSCDATGPGWSAAIASLDALLVALRAWQPTGLPPAPPTAQDIAALTTFGAAIPDSDTRGSADAD